MNRIRPLQFKNTFISDISIIHSHYLNQMNLNQVKEKKHLITLLQLLVYVRGLKYNTQRLRAKYRQFRFPLHDFLKYTGKTRNQYQLNKFKDFFDLVRQNFVIESFSDTHYRMLVTIPEVYVSKSEQNIWNVEIWIAEELFKTKNLIDSTINVRPLSHFQQCQREKLFSIPKSDFYPGHLSWIILKLEELLKDEQVKEAIKERPEKYRVLIEDKDEIEST